MSTMTVVLALVLDRFLGEPRRGHPLVGFGAISTRLEFTCRRWVSGYNVGAALRIAGSLAWLLLVAAPVAALLWIQAVLPDTLSWAFAVVILYYCIGYRSLDEHCRAIAEPLADGRLDVARGSLAMIVSRDTQDLDDKDVSRGALESLLENGSDAVVAPVFWFLVAGAPGALGYRLANTLDAMWGYRNKKYREFGWCAARADDVLNIVPARLCALAYALAGSTRMAFESWGSQARAHDSPNAGPVIAAGAGALGLRLGGPAYYGGIERWRPVFGLGADPEYVDIYRGLRLLCRALLLLLFGCALIEVFL